MRYYYSLLILFFFILTATSLADTNVTTALTLNDSNKPIILAHNVKQFTINLKSNRSTGYGWYLKNYDAHLIRPVSQTYYPSTRNLPGAAGIDSFVFKVQSDASVVNQLAQITFVYSRPWNLETNKTVTFNIITHSS